MVWITTVTRGLIDLWIFFWPWNYRDAFCSEMMAWYVSRTSVITVSQSVARPQGSGVTIATNVISIWQKPIRQKARNNVTHTRPSAGHQLLHVCARLLGHTETHSGFQRSFHISQIIRSGSKQNIQKGSVSRLPVCPFSYTAFSLNDIFSKIW